MKDSLESRLGIFFLLAIVVALVVLESLGGFAFLHRGYRVHALFQNVQELKVGGAVKMAGVQIGRVQEIRLTNSLADVTLNLNRENEVKTDSKASISFTGLMGENYVSLTFGSVAAPRAEEGAILQSVEQPDLGQLMSKLDNVASGVENLTRSFSGEKIDNLLGPFTDFLKNNQTNLTASIANIKTVTERIALGQGTVGKLINEDTLYATALNSISNLQSTAADIDSAAGKARELITNANDVVLAVRGGQGTVGKLLTDDTLYIEATGTMTNAHQILLKINHGQGTVGQLINDDSILKNAKLSLQKLDKATESLEDTGPLSVLGTMVSSLFLSCPIPFIFQHDNDVRAAGLVWGMILGAPSMTTELLRPSCLGCIFGGTAYPVATGLVGELCVFHLVYASNPASFFSLPPKRKSGIL